MKKAKNRPGIKGDETYTAKDILSQYLIQGSCTLNHRRTKMMLMSTRYLHVCYFGLVVTDILFNSTYVWHIGVRISSLQGN